MPRARAPVRAAVADFCGGAGVTAATAAPRRLEGVETAAGGAREAEALNDTGFVRFKASPEAWRFISYLFFWTMCLLAIACNRFLSAPRLLKGAPDGLACPPFEVGGKGFDVHTDSHLNRRFGFNNICVNWDYSPSRELIALYYPTFEYSLLIHLVLDFLSAAVSYKKGIVHKYFWYLNCITFPIQIVLCAWFRMIFVVRAFESVQGHTAGFLGLQVALAIVAGLNVMYIVGTGVSYDFFDFLGGDNGTTRAAWAFFFLTMVVDGVKIYLTLYVVRTGLYPDWAKSASSIPGHNWGQFVDLFWMILNAIVPVFVSFYRARTEMPLEIRIGLETPPIISKPKTQADSSNVAEAQPLNRQPSTNLDHHC